MIICDTNIWYDIGDGTISWEKVKKLPLTSTILSIQELLNSPNLIDRADNVRGAVAAIKAFRRQILVNPFLLGILRFEPQYPVAIEVEGGQKEWENIKTLLHTQINIPEEDRAAMREIRNEYTNAKDIKSLTEFFNEKSKEVRQYLETNNLEQERMEMDYAPHFKKNISDLLMQYHLDSNKEFTVEIQPTSDCWNDLELITEMWAAYSKEFDISQKTTPRKIRDNDWVDILNAFYVGRNDLYWTKDKYCLDLMNANPKMKKYMFELN